MKIELPVWLKDYGIQDFRMWIFEQTTSLFNNKFENVSGNLAAVLQNEERLNRKATPEEMKEPEEI